jgi:hypothetical protein
MAAEDEEIDSLLSDQAQFFKQGHGGWHHYHYQQPTIWLLIVAGLSLILNVILTLTLLGVNCEQRKSSYGRHLVHHIQ